jgi:hypothetical protein
MIELPMKLLDNPEVMRLQADAVAAADHRNIYLRWK